MVLLRRVVFGRRPRYVCFINVKNLGIATVHAFLLDFSVVGTEELIPTLCKLSRGHGVCSCIYHVELGSHGTDAKEEGKVDDRGELRFYEVKMDIDWKIKVAKMTSRKLPPPIQVD